MRLITGIASTTHVDLHGERIAKSALSQFAEQICSKFIPTLIEHDPNRQIGILLYGKVAQLEDGEFALYVVSGIFDCDKEEAQYKVGSPNIVWQQYTHYLSDIKPTGNPNLNKNVDSKHKIENNNSSVVDLLETHLDSTQIWNDGRVYKIKRFISSSKDLRIYVYKDHLPPHFHVISKQRAIDARFNLNTLEYINSKKGGIRESDIKKIQNFFELHPEILLKLKNEHTRMNL